MDKRRSGWLTFASIMLILAGIGNFTWGIAAIARQELLAERLVFANLTFWGIIFMVVGASLVAAGLAVLNGALWGRLIGLVFCSLSVAFHLSVIWTHPAFSVLAIAVDTLVIYALTVHAEHVAS
ncbi:MAG: hypothetical protein KKF41_02625 [Actinobacteria bacterium]|nr:hypothetical protein [Actinomycetota bacterium]MBU1943521.1 hypothetical protein [Actinomycetota bacterium]MBU2686462.1 hypothetical protein [Actinomycetota bacterium]